MSTDSGVAFTVTSYYTTESIVKGITQIIISDVPQSHVLIYIHCSLIIQVVIVIVYTMQDVAASNQSSNH